MKRVLIVAVLAASFGVSAGGMVQKYAGYKPTKQEVGEWIAQDGILNFAVNDDLEAHAQSDFMDAANLGNIRATGYEITWLSTKEEFSHVRLDMGAQRAVTRKQFVEWEDNLAVAIERERVSRAGEDLARIKGEAGTTTADNESAASEKRVAAAQYLEAMHPYRLNGLTMATTIANWH